MIAREVQTSRRTINYESRPLSMCGRQGAPDRRGFCRAECHADSFVAHIEMWSVASDSRLASASSGLRNVRRILIGVR